MEWIDYDERWIPILELNSTLYVYMDAHKEYYIAQYQDGWKYRAVTLPEYVMVNQLIEWSQISL